MTQCDLTILQPWLASGALISAAKDSVWLGWGGLIRSEQPTAPSFFAPDFFLTDPRPYWAFENTARVSLASLAQGLRKLKAYDQTLAWNEAASSGFYSTFDELQNRFHEGMLKKAVPVISDQADWPKGADPVALKISWILNAITYSSSAAVYLYGIWDGIGDGTADQGAGILGATPELLIDFSSHSSWSTVALAGTRRDSERDARSRLLDDPKEMREHQLVIEGIKNSLKPWGEISLGETTELRLPGLSHLKTSITLHAGTKTTFDELVRGLHPTPALGTWPREVFREVLQALDIRLKTDRRRFGAPFGFSNPEFKRALVAIRNLQWDESGVTASAGCGIIAESVAEREWLELRAKIASVKRIFET